MKEFLERVKLSDHLTTELQILKSEFVKELKNHVDEGETGIFSSSFDMFSSSKNEFKGKVNNEGFKIKRKRRFFDMNLNMAVASGKYEQKGEILVMGIPYFMMRQSTQRLKRELEREFYYLTKK